jgi:hypothetical protein
VEIHPAKPRMAAKWRECWKKRHFVTHPTDFSHLGLAKLPEIWSLARPVATLNLNHVTRQHHSFRIAQGGTPIPITPYEK